VSKVHALNERQVAHVLAIEEAQVEGPHDSGVGLDITADSCTTANIREGLPRGQFRVLVCRVPS
jgi:hypothetical protein